MTTPIDLNTFKHYGASTIRVGLTKIEGPGGFSSSGAPIDNAGLLDTLRQDLIRSWQMWDGVPEQSNKLVDAVTGNDITRNFFTEIGDPSAGLDYSGTANFGVDAPSSPRAGIKLQHVVILETSDYMSPNQGTVTRGVDQKYRMRMEYDERPRLYAEDKEFAYELYQLNIKLREIGGVEYVTGNTIDDTEFAQAFPAHIGYNQINVLLNTGWENSIGIPNPAYTWLKIQTGTKNQIFIDGNTSDNLSYNDGLITLENGLTINTAVSRLPGEIVDINHEDITWVATAQSEQFVGDGETTLFTITQIPAFANTDTVVVDGTTKTLAVDYTVSGNNITFTVAPADGAVIVVTKPASDSRSVRFRNKRKGPGWFKRFPLASDANPNVAGTYPITYRVTLTERGFFLALYNEAGVDENDNYAWICCQRTVNNETGLPRTDEASRFPVHCIYSCSREGITPRDFGVYFSESAANLQTVDNELGPIYDPQGNSYNVSELTDSLYILNPYDREDYLADEFLEKKIWRFVIREMDILKPWDAHKRATKHQTDSNAIINPQEQLAITDDNRFVITFPTGLTSQRYMYPKEEMDLICFSSAEVVAESSNVPMQTYKYDGTNIDYRRYQGIRSTLPNGNGMRVMCLVQAQNIYNSDINI